ncbi:hypothetical protein [Pseudomonas sp. NY15374]|uniref:hypothetical protein n=1 Tax=Pseudomonas sp. NY15374 TaxID=3400357 RepID=UPI003A837A8F
MNAGSPITQGTLEAVRSSADVVLTSMERGIDGDRVAFSLCTRTPCCSRVHGGYCYLNNSAIAAERCLRRGAKRVAILDVDYHPGNGTQIIFYDRNDVFFRSINGVPVCYTPYLSGFAAERGPAREWASMPITHCQRALAERLLYPFADSPKRVQAHSRLPRNFFGR